MAGWPAGVVASFRARRSPRSGPSQARTGVRADPSRPDPAPAWTPAERDPAPALPLHPSMHFGMAMPFPQTLPLHPSMHFGMAMPLPQTLPLHPSMRFGMAMPLPQTLPLHPSMRFGMAVPLPPTLPLQPAMHFGMAVPLPQTLPLQPPMHFGMAMPLPQTLPLQPAMPLIRTMPLQPAMSLPRILHLPQFWTCSLGNGGAKPRPAGQPASRAFRVWLYVRRAGCPGRSGEPPARRGPAGRMPGWHRPGNGSGRRTGQLRGHGSLLLSSRRAGGGQAAARRRVRPSRGCLRPRPLQAHGLPRQPEGLPAPSGSGDSRPGAVVPGGLRAPEDRAVHEPRPGGWHPGRARPRSGPLPRRGDLLPLGWIRAGSVRKARRVCRMWRVGGGGTPGRNRGASKPGRPRRLRGVEGGKPWRERPAGNPRRLRRVEDWNPRRSRAVGNLRRLWRFRRLRRVEDGKPRRNRAVGNLCRFWRGYGGG
jgi:hypothetical protein